MGNQAYGYLWPMGPFFRLGDLRRHARLGGAAALDRRSSSCVAFRAPPVWRGRSASRSDLAVILAGLAYALSPRMLSTVGPISIEAWPSALAPWVLLALVLGSRGLATAVRPRRASAVAMVGGVNAAATLAVSPRGVWLLTRTAPGRGAGS